MSAATRSSRATRSVDGPTARRSRRRTSPTLYLGLNGATMVAIAAVALGGIGILYLIQTSHVAGLGYRLSHLEDRRHELALENAELGYGVAGYRSLETINRLATEELGMVHLQNYQFLTVQRPAQQEVSVPPAPTTPAEPLWHQAWRAVTGIGHAEAPVEGPPALPRLSGGD